MRGPRARIVFDLDGTLVDSAPSLCAAGNAMIAEMGRAPVEVDTYKRFVGRGMRKQIEGLLAHTGGVPEDFEGRFARFREIYDADPLVATRPYPGVGEALAALAGQGHVLGVCTQKAQAPARAILTGLSLMPPIAALTGGDSVATLKPDPAMLAHTLSQMPGDGPVLFVGDSETDAETARRADVPFLLHLNGYRHGEVAARAAFAAWSDLPHLIEEALASI
ncbi:MAG: HAD-IA family hydrolase [Rubricella sp.]